MKHVFAIAALVLATACTTHHVESDSKSTWLRYCAERAQCPEDAACVCGVCTKACENADACAGLSDAQTVCVNPSAQGLPGCQSDLATGPNVCLLACQTSAECEGALSCVRGVCISATLAEAGTPAATTLDATTPPAVGHPALDGGSTTHVEPFDAGHTKPTTGPTTPPMTDPDDDGGLPACTCSVGLVCSIPVTCATEGVKVLTTELSGNVEIYAADADLATNEVKPLTTPGYEWTWMSFADGAVYGASAGSGSGSFWVVDLPTARRTLLASESVVVTSNVAVSGAVYAMMSQFANASQRLVRIELKP